ncbi:MAG TPA: hypothetical protein PKM73_14480 [Verrucomicrobiota bacterium]|nr:hypothetical protein [Verrucomicrobiota bacterium]
MILIAQPITLVASAGTPAATVSMVIKPPNGRLVFAALKVPTLGDAGHTAKVSLASVSNPAVLLLPDSVVGSGTAAHNATAHSYISAANGGFYPLAHDHAGLTALITVSANQTANRAFVLYLGIEP